MKLDRIKKLSPKQLTNLGQKSEFTIQCEIVNWCRINDVLIFSVPNEATRNKPQFTKSGVLAGVSDLILVQDEIIYVEVKTHNGTQSKNQKEFQKRVEALGHKYKIVRSLEQFKSIIT